MKVYEKIAAVTAELSRIGISKDSKNTSQGYAFRGIDQVYGALSPLLAKHGLCILPRVKEREVIERQNRSGTALFYVCLTVEFDFVAAEDGSKHTIVTIGEAMDSGDKASNKAMSAAYKYAAIQTFCIPTEGDNDADSTTHEVRGGFTVDPRGELGKAADTSKRDQFVSEFRAAFDLDADENEIAQAIYGIHQRISTDHDLYISTADAMNSKERSAIKKYIEIYRKNQNLNELSKGFAS
jgi:ERF superfamily